MRRRALIVSLVLACLVPAGPAPAVVPVGGAVRLADAGVRPLVGRARENVVAFARLLGYVRFFHPSDQAVKADWDRVAVAALPEVERAPDAQALLSALRTHFEPLAPAVALFPCGKGGVWQPPPPPPGPVRLVAAWTHAGLGLRAAGPFQATRQVMVVPDGRLPTELPSPGEAFAAELGGGVACRVPLALWADHWGTVPQRPLPAPPMLAGSLHAARRAVRLTAVAQAWNAVQHFHPRVDRAAWRARLPAALAEAAEAPDAEALTRVLRRLAARLDDGRAGASGPAAVRLRPPVTLDWVEERLVVVATRPGVKDVARGDEVLAIDGRAAGERLAEEVALVAGATPARRRFVAAQDLLAGPRGTSVGLRLRRPGRAPWVVTLKRAVVVSGGNAGARPSAIARLTRGLWYVDLTRTDERAWRRARFRLARATGIVFDLRGQVMARTMAHALGGLAGQPVRTPGFEVPRPKRPDDARPPRGYVSYVIPAGDKLPARATFLIDASTFDLGDVAAAAVAHYRLGTLVGAPTAGAAGHPDAIALPGRFSLTWTGSDARDYAGGPLGSVRPDEPVPRTVAAVRDGRDEALERAIALLGEALPGLPSPTNQN